MRLRSKLLLAQVPLALALALVGCDASLLLPELELPPSTTTSTTATAITTTSRLPAIVSRCLRCVAALAAASCSSRRCRAASLSALRDAI